MDDGGQRERREIYYSGWVQGVGFRYTVQRLAARFLLTGFVRNSRDGRVELVLEGAPDEIQRLMKEIQDALGNYIRGVQQTSGPATDEFPRFEIRH